MNSQKGCAVVIVVNTVETSEPTDKYKDIPLITKINAIFKI